MLLRPLVLGEVHVVLILSPQSLDGLMNILKYIYTYIHIYIYVLATNTCYIYTSTCRNVQNIYMVNTYVVNMHVMNILSLIAALYIHAALRKSSSQDAPSRILCKQWSMNEAIGNVYIYV